MASEFQPTLPARGATPRAVHRDAHARHFNPRSPHGERHSSRGVPVACIHHFNPRSPHGERLRCWLRIPSEDEFQPTLPARGATPDATDYHYARYISTHAPRTGSDAGRARITMHPPHFNPRSPHGERRFSDFPVISGKPFQPTLPARGATRTAASRPCPPAYFNPRSPHGERHDGFCSLIQRARLFQPTLPARGATSS